MKIIIVAFDKFTDIDVFLAWDLFNRARFRHKDISVKIVAIKGEIISVSGMRTIVQGTIEEANTADVVYFVSGPGTRDFIKNQRLLDLLKLDPTKQIICSMCSGSLILAKLGLLSGMQATTYPNAVEQMKSHGVEIVNKSLVINGNIATAAGCLAGVELIGWIIEKLFGKKLRDEVITSVQPVGHGLELVQ